MSRWVAGIVCLRALAGCRAACAPPGFVGPWTDGTTTIYLNRDGTYNRSSSSGPPAQGHWTEANGILTREADGQRTQDRWEARDKGWTLVLTPVSPPGAPVTYRRR